ncbi:MAG: sensor domain-containing diguanylate cyclase [Thiopseudomonas sp.]|nr:sensor domain-containing diguanylate cyclase [Thiopseudomonas sp.]
MKTMLNIEKRIMAASALLVLLTGMLVSLASILPMYHSVRSQIEAASLANARARQTSIDYQLASYQAIARQFTSRTEIRKRLEAWLQQDISLQELQDYSLPRLQEPASQTPQLAAMFRISQGETIAAIGDYASQIPARALQTDSCGTCFFTLSETDNDTPLVKASAAIQNAAGTVIGYDILFFHPTALAHHLQGFANYDNQAKIFLYQHNPPLALGRSIDDPEGTALYPHALDAVMQPSSLPPPPGLHRLSGGEGSILIVHPLEQGNSSLIIQVPAPLFYALAYHNLYWIYALILALLLLATLASRQAIRPLLSTLTRQTKQLHQHQTELRLAASVFENTREAIAITDPSLHIIRANSSMQRLSGCNQDELTGQPLSHYLHMADPHNQPFFLQRQLCETGRWQGEVGHTHKRGDSLRTSLLNISTVYDDNGTALYHIHIFSDITARKSAELKIRQLAEHDPLTGLLNRASILQCIRDAIERQQRFSLLFIDLDKFKPVNDTHGHQAGDQVLQLVAKRLQSAARSSDIIARIGGDEFLILLETPDSREFVQRIAADIVHRLTQPFDIESALVEIGASLGIAHFPEHGTSADTITHAADLAMYSAKRNGGNQFHTADGHQDS